MTREGTPPQEGRWAPLVDELHIAHELPAEALNLNVEGHKVAPMAGGFGRMWQKTYRISLRGADVSPEEVVRVWKTEFPDFWVANNRFYKPVGEITAGDVALINLQAGGVKLSTGILVLYTDDVSFSFICPEGHMFAGMITFSADRDDDQTWAQVHLFIRTQDPLSELAMVLGGHRLEDWNWMAVLRNLARRFGVDAHATKNVVCLDKRRRWSEWRNVGRNAGLHSLGHVIATPLRALVRRSRAA